jgi:hypothetical protein
MPPVDCRRARFTRRASEEECVFMSTAFENEGKGGKDDAPTELERQFLAALLDRLTEEWPQGRDQIIEADPEIIEQIYASSQLRSEVAAALSGKTVPLTDEQREIGELTAREIGRRGMLHAGRYGTSEGLEPSGILTSLTRQLAPEKAMLLYRKIAPVFVFQILNKLNESASLRDVHRFVDHLCNETVLARLAACEHVRDGILDELRAVMGSSDIRLELSREDLQQILVECGAMQDLVAMENCIRLSASKAG